MHSLCTQIISGKRILAGLMLVSMVCLFPAQAADKQDQRQLQREIRQLDKIVDTARDRAKEARTAVRAIEKKIGEISRKEHQTEQKISTTNKRLKKNAARKTELTSKLDEQKQGLAQQLQLMYSSGSQSHIRMLLKQDNPSDIGRTLKYLEYLNRTRIKKISGIKNTLDQIATADKELLEDQQQLKQLQTELKAQKKETSRMLAKRSESFKTLQKNAISKERRLQRLLKKEKSLQGQIDRLERQRSRPTPGTRPATTTKKKQKVGVNQSFKPTQKLSSMRGKIPWPVKGQLIHRYGTQRNEKQRWKGVVIKASGGARVKAIARGKVEFAGWFNGYGYLVIIRHDNSYRSLYGYNRSVYVSEGQIVNGGQTIAAVGNSGGQKQNALYFEIRKGTQPRNPAKWCR